MANICDNYYIIEFSSEEKAKAFSKILNKVLEKNISWIDFLCDEVGIDETYRLHTSEWLEMVDYYGGDDMAIATSSKWVPCVRVWDLIIKKVDPQAKLHYEAIEPGMGIFCSNSPMYIGEYAVDYWDEEQIPVHTLEAGTRDKGQVYEFLKELFNSPNASFEELLNKFNQSEYSYNMFIHEIEERAIEDWSF